MSLDKPIQRIEITILVISTDELSLDLTVTDGYEARLASGADFTLAKSGLGGSPGSAQS